MKHSFLPSFDEQGDAAVQYETIPLLRLEHGGALKSARLGFCVFAEQASMPVIMLHPALTGSPRAVTAKTPDQGDGWWQDHIGPGRLLDTSLFTVVCVDHLGGNGWTTGACELGVLQGTLTFRDTVRLTAEVLKKRGIHELFAVVGGSIGGGQAFEWLYQEEVRVRKIVDISGSGFHSADVAAFFQLQADILCGAEAGRRELSSALKYNLRDLSSLFFAFDHVCCVLFAELSALGRSYDPGLALQAARKVGFLRFVTPRFFQNKYDHYRKKGADHHEALEGLERWLEHQGERFARRFTAPALRELSIMVAQAPPHHPRLLAALLARHSASLWGFTVQGDVLFRAERQRGYYRQVRESLPEAITHSVQLICITDEVHGHDHFLSRKFASTSEPLRRWLRGERGNEGDSCGTSLSGGNRRGNSADLLDLNLPERQ